MYFGVIHSDITSWARFNSLDVEHVPEGVKPLGYFPSVDHGSAVCLWYTESENALRTYLDGACQGLCSNTYYQIDEKAAYGLPMVPAPV